METINKKTIKTLLSEAVKKYLLYIQLSKKSIRSFVKRLKVIQTEKNDNYITSTEITSDSPKMDTYKEHLLSKNFNTRVKESIQNGIETLKQYTDL